MQGNLRDVRDSFYTWSHPGLPWQPCCLFPGLSFPSCNVRFTRKEAGTQDHGGRCQCHSGGRGELGIPTPQWSLEALPLWGGRKVRVLVVSNPRKRKTGKTRDQRPIAGRGRRLPARGGWRTGSLQPPPSPCTHVHRMTPSFRPFWKSGPIDRPVSPSIQPRSSASFWGSYLDSSWRSRGHRAGVRPGGPLGTRGAPRPRPSPATSAQTLAREDSGGGHGVGVGGSCSGCFQQHLVPWRGCLFSAVFR